MRHGSSQAFCIANFKRPKVRDFDPCSSTVQEAGFAGKRNGELLALAEQAFDLFLTLDKNLRYQQNLEGRKIAILIVQAKSNRIADVRPYVPACLVAVQTIHPGQIVEVPNK
jgi:hypothetical protein